jgi:hypothetical protein
LKMADRNEPVLAHVNALEIAEFVDGVDRWLFCLINGAFYRGNAFDSEHIIGSFG